LEVGQEINSIIGKIRFPIDGYFDFNGFIQNVFSWTVLNIEASLSRGTYNFNCTVGVCSNYFVEGKVRVGPYSQPYLALRVKKCK